MSAFTPELIQEPAGVASREGCYVCGRCRRVAHPSQREIDLAESMPNSRVLLKCPGCHHRAVEWHVPSPIRTKAAPQPVSVARGAELFAVLHQAIG